MFADLRENHVRCCRRSRRGPLRNSQRNRDKQGSKQLSQHRHYMLLRLAHHELRYIQSTVRDNGRRGKRHRHPPAITPTAAGGFVCADKLYVRCLACVGGNG
ncbi:unnamed protein product [Periconia digitata]|uniref:Uncharacterized protein n=1 Tax=Periconia digitata TaxID=1303443 RepID=A0A9W4XWU7_9PLEO|nr:unnamed protein product [Periconia digitata]